MALAHLLVAMGVYRRHPQTYTVRDQRGFTLVELMIVCAIIAIGVLLAVPNYLQWNSQHQLRQAVTEVHSQLMLARMAAMNRSAAIRVALAVSGGRVTMSIVDDNSGVMVMSPTTFMTGVSYVVGGPIVFSPLGLRLSGTVGSAQNITLKNTSGLQYGVKVTPGGKAIWCASATCV